MRRRFMDGLRGVPSSDVPTVISIERIDIKLIICRGQAWLSSPRSGLSRRALPARAQGRGGNPIAKALFSSRDRGERAGAEARGPWDDASRPCAKREASPGADAPARGSPAYPPEPAT